MARRVGYFEDFATEEDARAAFAEGPFVIVNAWGWRIESEVKDVPHPAVLDGSVYTLLTCNGFRAYKEADDEAGRREAERKCDWLNEQVRKGNIVLSGRLWVARDPTSLAMATP